MVVVITSYKKKLTRKKTIFLVPCFNRRLLLMMVSSCYKSNIFLHTSK